MQFYERLYELRKRSGMTQNELAEKLDISRQAVSRWEMGTAKPDIDNLVALSDLFGVTLDYLLKGEPPPAASEPASGEPEKPKQKSNAWPGFMLLLYIVLFALIAITNLDGIGAMVTAAVLVGAVWLIKIVICWIIRLFRA